MSTFPSQKFKVVADDLHRWYNLFRTAAHAASTWAALFLSTWHAKMLQRYLIIEPIWPDEQLHIRPSQQHVAKRQHLVIWMHGVRIRTRKC